jgi:hypothetical protein
MGCIQTRGTYILKLAKCIIKPKLPSSIISSDTNLQTRKISTQTNRMIKCFSIKNTEKINNICNNAEMILKQDLPEEKAKKTTKTSSSRLVSFSNELDDENIAEIKTSLCNHYLFTDLSVQIM